MANTSSQRSNIEEVRAAEGSFSYPNPEATEWSEFLVCDGLHAVFPQAHQEVMQVHDLLNGDAAEIFLKNFWWLKEIQLEGAEPPFLHKRQTETHVIGVELPEVCIYNFDQPLSDKEREAIRLSNGWFSGITNGKIYEFASIVQLGANLGFGELPDGKKFPVSGVRYKASRDVFPIAISEHVMQGESLKRYVDLLDKGVTMLEIVLTHEMAHALTYWYPQILERYQDEVDWQGIPINEYPQGRVYEDIAESFVYLRFLPDTLAGDRAISLTRSLTDTFGRRRSKQPPPKIILLPESIYPHVLLDEAVGRAIQRAGLLQELVTAHLL